MHFIFGDKLALMKPKITNLWFYLKENCDIPLLARLKYKRTLMTFVCKFLIFICILIPAPGYSDKNLLEEMDGNGTNVIFLRHTLAPGFGDPKNFILGDCSTQRNLSKEGKEQAKFLGQWLKSENVSFTEILSSEWCRCIDTVKEMRIGNWSSFSGLNSFFQEFYPKEKVVIKLRNKLSGVRANDLVLMVTHLVVIREITGISPPSGGLVLYNTKSGTSQQIDFSH